MQEEPIMVDPFRAACQLILAIALVGPAAAQRLPTGEYNANRERAYDLLHYRAEIRFDFEQGRVLGHSKILLAPLRALSELALDAIGLEVESVELAPAGEALEFEVRDNSLVIKLPTASSRGDRVALGVRYKATPRGGMYFLPDPENPGLYFVTTYGEGGLHANWLPIYGGVNDKLTTEMVVTVPEPYVVVSNGTLKETRKTAKGETTYRWLQERPHPAYLVALYVGDLERGELEPAFGEIPLSYWVPRGRLEEGAYAFRNTTRMVEYFSDRFGYLYPWVKYDQIAIPDYPVGAMEHTGVTGHNASVLRLADAPVDFGGPTFDEYFTDWSAEATISHELAHHWFGDNLTCRNLSYLWLNESFASYLMMLWDEESLGRDQLDFDVDLAKRHYFSYVGEEHIIRPLEYHYFDDPNTIYNEEHTYLKGAVVLHLLRAVLGDDDFFGALRYYLHKHEFSSVESQDLKTAIEEATGRNLDWFWQDWITGGGHPHLEVTSRYLADRQQVDLLVRQVQPIIKAQGLFRLPATVTLATPSGSRSETVWLEKESERFLLPSAEEPLMVSFDGGGQLVAEVSFHKEPQELIYQAEHDALPGRLKALRQLAARFPTREETAEALAASLAADRFWGERAEAARLLGSVRTPDAEELAIRALAADDYRVRKAAVLALAELGTQSAAQSLQRVIREEPHSDVVGAAIVALAQADPETATEVFAAPLQRDAWYDEIRIAALRALAKLDRPELASLVRPYAAADWNQDVRQAAARAWKKASPADPDLHAVLLDMARSPSYKLQMFAIEELGNLYVTAAVPYLEDLESRDVDPNLTVLARDALAEIRRIAPPAE
jgi:aminopeptidase N